MDAFASDSSRPGKQVAKFDRPPLFIFHYFRPSKNISAFYPPSMRLYRTSRGIILQNQEHRFIFQDDWDRLINSQDLQADLRTIMLHADRLNEDQAKVIIDASLLPPIGSQEVWAAGVTYMRSR